MRGNRRRPQGDFGCAPPTGLPRPRPAGGVARGMRLSLQPKQSRATHVRHHRRARATTGAATIALGLAFAGDLAAQDGDATMIAPAADRNGDGFYSYPELRRIHPDVAEDEFSRIDASGDGLIDREELSQAYRSGQLSPKDG